MITVSKATKKDLDQLKQFFSHYKVDVLIENKIKDFTFITTAKEGKKIIALIKWSIKRDPSLGVVEIEEVNVLMSYQKKGVGSKLMEFTVQSIKDYFQKNKLNLRKIYTFVYENNLAAQNFYEKFGFKKESKIKKMFSDLDNSLLYLLKINLR